MSDHLFGVMFQNDNLYFSSGPAGGADPSIGQPCPAANECAVESTTGPTDLTGLFNALHVSDIGGVQLMTVESVDRAQVPEPATVALLGIGLVGLWGGRRLIKAS